MSEGPSGHFELDLCSREKDFGKGRTFESSGDLLENHDTEMLPLPAEECPVIGEPKTLLRKRQVKQLLSMTERILGPSRVVQTSVWPVFPTRVFI